RAPVSREPYAYPRAHRQGDVSGAKTKGPFNAKGPFAGAAPSSFCSATYTRGADAPRRGPSSPSVCVMPVTAPARYLSAFSPASTFSASQRAMRPRPDQVSPVLGSRYFTAAAPPFLRTLLRASLRPTLPLPPSSSDNWRRSASILTRFALWWV